MFNEMKALIKKHWEIIIYLIFGGLTTLVDFLVYWPLLHWLRWPATASNAVAWVAAVVFAFLTNKPFVFKSNDWRPKTFFPELGKFVGCRLASFALSEVFLAITVDWLNWHGLLMKLIISVAVIILN